MNIDVDLSEIFVYYPSKLISIQVPFDAQLDSTRFFNLILTVVTHLTKIHCVYRFVQKLYIINIKQKCLLIYDSIERSITGQKKKSQLNSIFGFELKP